MERETPDSNATTSDGDKGEKLNDVKVTEG